MISIILLTAGLIAYLLKSLDFIYLFQTKEYRLDRIITFLKEQNIIRLLYLRKIRLPAVTLRNFLISQFIFLNTVLLTYSLIRQSLTVLFIYIIITPVLAFLSMLLGVFLSEIPVRIYRKKIISQAKNKVRNSKAIFIGITGSYGKTSTKEFLYQILSQKFKVAKTNANYNSEVGVAISILGNLKPDTEYFIAELGAYKKGEIKAACDIIHPTYGIITNIGNQHLSLFGSKKNLVDAKAELIESLPLNGTAYINKEIKEWKILAGKTKAKIRFFTTSDYPPNYKTNLLGEHSIQNLSPCIVLAVDLGLDKKLIAKSVFDLKPIAGRLTERRGFNESTILDDSYNSNVEGFIAAIKIAQEMSFKKKYIISRGLIELGEEKKPSYLDIIDILEKSDLILLTTDVLFRDLAQDNKVVAFQNEATLLDYTKEKTDKNTLIVIEGRFEPKTLIELLKQ